MKSEIIDDQLHVEGLKEPLVRLEHRTLWLTVDAVVFSSSYDRSASDEPVSQTLRIRGRGRMDPGGHKFRIAGTNIWTDVVSFNLRSMEETVETQQYLWTAMVSFLKESSEFGFGNYFFVEGYVPENVLADMKDAVLNSKLLRLKVGFEPVGLWVERHANYVPFDCGFDWMLQPNSDGNDVKGYHGLRIKNLIVDVGDDASLETQERMERSSDPDDDGSSEDEGSRANSGKKRLWFG